MGTELARTDTAAVMERVLMVGDLSKLSAAERVSYYLQVCESLGLNPATRPFDYITLQGKMTLYARRDAADQLRRRDKISITITAREKVDDVYVVTARATTPDRRTDEAIGAVPLAGLRGEALANAFMKAETKSKRRVTLSICGLGFTDESEVDSIPGAQRVQVSDDGEIIDLQSKPAAETQPTPQPTAQTAPKPTAQSASQLSGNPGELVLPFGKYKGQSLSDTWAKDSGYVQWLADKAQDEQVKLAAQTLLQGQAPQPAQASGPSEAQLKRLFAMANGVHVTNEEIKGYISMQFGVESTKALTREQYDETCAWIEGHQAQPAPAEPVDDSWSDEQLEPPADDTFGDQCGQLPLG
ncbi:MAG: hypothetical protein VB144_11765 [Clostridia bacterium]|nr:hypothetical protein [Clostridia bacterium]